MKPAQGLAAFMRETCRINRHQVPEDRRVRRQRGRLFQYVLERQIIEPRERHPLLKRFELSTHLLQPELFVWGIANHHGHVFRVRQEAQDIVDDARKIVCEWDDGVIWSEFRGVYATL